jgi:hypothetical protein
MMVTNHFNSTRPRPDRTPHGGGGRAGARGALSAVPLAGLLREIVYFVHAYTSSLEQRHQHPLTSAVIHLGPALCLDAGSGCVSLRHTLSLCESCVDGAVT